MKVKEFLDLFVVVQELIRDIDIPFSLKLRLKEHFPKLEQKLIIVQDELNGLLKFYGVERENQKGTFDLIPKTKLEYDSKVNEILDAEIDCDFHIFTRELEKSKMMTAEKLLRLSKILKEDE